MNEEKSAPRAPIYEKYALGLAAGKALPGSGGGPSERLSLLRKLASRYLKGWPERMTLYTKSLPPGCGPCLDGKGSNLVVTGQCNRSCFFCFNPRPREDGMAVHGRAIHDPEEAPAIIEKLGIKSVGLSGGEPLLFPGRTVAILRALRRRFGRNLRVDLYANGDFLTEPLLAVLREEGLDGLRVDLAANGFSVAPVRAALKFFRDVTVEMPVPPIPAKEERMRSLILELDAAGAPHLILHELFFCAQNQEELAKYKFQAKTGQDGSKLMWGPVEGSEEMILGLLMFAHEKARNLSAYYCSCETQDWIAEKALARRST